MKLIGRYRSPYTRRVAVTMHLLDMPYEHVAVTPSKDGEIVRRHNPLRLIPALVLDDGETLVDSAAILDHLDEQAGPDRALTPPSGAPRRRVQKVVAIALQTLWKEIEVHHEIGRKAEDKRDQAWIDECATRVLDGFRVLDGMAGAAHWLAGEAITQADITTVCAFDFSDADMPSLKLRQHFPHLTALSDRCNAMSAFARAAPEV